MNLSNQIGQSATRETELNSLCTKINLNNTELAVIRERLSAMVVRAFGANIEPTKGIDNPKLTPVLTGTLSQNNESVNNQVSLITEINKFISRLEDLV